MVKLVEPSAALVGVVTELPLQICGGRCLPLLDVALEALEELISLATAFLAVLKLGIRGHGGGTGGRGCSDSCGRRCRRSQASLVRLLHELMGLHELLAVQVAAVTSPGDKPRYVLALRHIPSSPVVVNEHPCGGVREFKVGHEPVGQLLFRDAVRLLTLAAEVDKLEHIFRRALARVGSLSHVLELPIAPGVWAFCTKPSLWPSHHGGPAVVAEKVLARTAIAAVERKTAGAELVVAQLTFANGQCTPSR
mmetsp:Transcript_46155/g.133767  ORF Transcript_46155/g.133767 Transcript_46155/m.133767 type:complete len:251 (+) Transcript_46155:461-1213(+)